MLDTATRLSMLQERYKSGTQKIFIESLNDAMNNITGKLVGLENQTEAKRLIAIKAQIEQEINALYGKLVEPIQTDMQGFAEISHESIFDALNGETGLGYAFASLPKDTMKKIISMNEIRLVGDKAYTLKELFGNAKTSQINNYKQIIAGGLASNSGYASIVKRLKGANARATTNIDAIVHTAISSARDMADVKAYDDFDDVITGWKSVSVLDSRTSLHCASLDGRMYYKKQGYPVYEKIPNRPPRHFRCRSRLVPKTDFVTDTKRPENGDNKGQVASKTKFNEWFSNQSEDFQRNYLGQGRYDLYKSGRLKIKDFVDVKNGQKFTLAEIKAKFLNKPPKPPKVKPIPKVEEIKIVPPTPKSSPKIKDIDFGYSQGRFNEYVKDIKDEAKAVISSFPFPASMKHNKKAWYRPFNISNSRGGDLRTTKNAPTFLHEYGHYLDQMLAQKNGGHNYYSKRLEEFALMDAKLYGTAKVVGRGKFAKERVMILKEDVQKLRDELYTYGEITKPSGYKYYGYTIRDMSNRKISDMFDSITGGDFQGREYGIYGHGRNYYLRNNMKQAENFANLFSNWSQGGDVWERTKKYFPNMSKEFEAIMFEVHGIKPKVAPKPKKPTFNAKDLLGKTDKELLDLTEFKNGVYRTKERRDIIKSNPITSAINYWSEEGYTTIRRHYSKGITSAPKEALDSLEKLFKMNGNYNGIMYRGLNTGSADIFKKLDGLKVGDDFTDVAPSSWTSSTKVAEDFANINNMDSYSVMLELESKGKSAYNIASVSEYPKELEVLYKPNAKIRVKETTYRIIDDEKVRVIILEEY